MAPRVIRLSDTLRSVFETDVAELALDPDAFGLDSDESLAVRLIAGHIHRGSFAVPESAHDAAIVRSELIAMANGYDDVAIGLTPGDGEARRFARLARDGLSALAYRIGSLAHA